MNMIFIALGAAAAVVVVACALFWKETVYEFERGLLFRKGVYCRTLLPGRYWFLPMRSMIQKIDVRLRTISVPSQEVLSSDNVTIKITLAAQYSVTDPALAVTKVEKFQDAFYMLLQISLRDLVGGLTIDEVIAKRQEIGKTLFEKTEAKVKDLGLTLHVADVKDIMFPGDLKKMFAQVVKARIEGQAILERARGESAALRNLANAAKMVDGNPSLIHLRLLQSIEAGTGNTMVLGFPSDMMPLPQRNKRQAGENSERLQPEEE